MPIYEYQCQKCERRTEAIQRIGERPLKICPHCGGKLKKLASAPAIQFKGSGWYVTDYARAKREEKGSSGDEKAETSEKPAEKTAEKAAEKTSEKSSEKKKEKKASKE
jgi:putative FmdB family regulatory protein